ncbi:MAG: right-handed parallel beta-helix repeat-containing protein [Emcibacter sp.]|nr:right-handed parallel beta-helix repeat-containing protein [Emcibacter sp.]
MSNTNVNPDAPILYDPITNIAYSNQNNAVIEAHNGVTIEGLSLRGEDLSSFGIRIKDKSNITIKNIDISGLLLPVADYSNGSGNGGGGAAFDFANFSTQRPDYYWNHPDQSVASPQISDRNVAGIEIVNGSASLSVTNIHMENLNVHDTTGTAVRLNLTADHNANRIDIWSGIFHNNLNSIVLSATGNSSGIIDIRQNIFGNEVHISLSNTNVNSANWDVELDHNQFNNTTLSLYSTNSRTSFNLKQNVLSETALTILTSNGNGNEIHMTDNSISGNRSKIGIYNAQNTILTLNNNIFQDSSNDGLLIINRNRNSSGSDISTTNNSFINAHGTGLTLYNQTNATLRLTMTSDIFTDNGDEGLELDNFSNSHITASLKGLTFQNNTLEAIEAENEGTSAFGLTLSENIFTNNGGGKSFLGYSSDTGTFTLNQSGNIFTGDDVPDLKFGLQLDKGLCFGTLASCTI